MPEYAFPDQQKYAVNVISAFGNLQGKAHYSGSMPLDAFHKFITGPQDDESGTLLTVEQAYSRVPWVRRGVNLIARSVSHMPYIITEKGRDITESSPVNERLLFVTQKSLEKYSRAYWLLESNRAGTRVAPRFAPAKSVVPVNDKVLGLVGFKLQFSTGARFVLAAGLEPAAESAAMTRYGAPLTAEQRLNRMVYFHVPSDEDETGADVSAVEVAREPASLLFAANRVASKFYAGGMVGVSMVVVPQTTQDDEVKRIEGFFRRMATGMRNALRVLGVRSGVDVKQIGQSIRESRVPELINEARDDVAVALDIPPTVLDGKAANFATAQSEWFGFVVNTVIPKAEFIEEIANAQYLKPLGMLMELQPNRLEIMQTAQLEQALAVVKLVGADQFGATQPIISLEEARALLGFPARQAADTVAPADEGGVVDETVKARRMWLSWDRVFRLAKTAPHANGHGELADAIEMLGRAVALYEGNRE